MINRRSLITGLVSLVAAPAIVRADSLMRVRGVILPPPKNFAIGRCVVSFNGEPIGNISTFEVFHEMVPRVEFFAHAKLELEEFNFDNLAAAFLGDGPDA